jgi:hypothetical protein
VSRLRTITRLQFFYSPAAAERASSEKNIRLLLLAEGDGELTRRDGKAGAA